MPRRRLQLICSSSDEDENEVHPIQFQPPLHQQQDMVEEILEPDEDEGDDRIISSINFQNVTIHSSSSSHSIPQPRNPNITQPVPFQISDSDSDSDHVTNSAPIHTDYPDGSIGSILCRMGLKLRMEWLESCVRALESSVPGFSRLDDLGKSKSCLEQALFADMNLYGAGVLPPNLHSLHLVDLKGPFVLQVDEIVNISSPLRSRYQNAAPGLKRCLKLSMTDGVQRVFGMEYRPIKDIDVLSPAGLKVVVSNVNVRHGLLMLVPEVIEVLGGRVEELEAAQQRLIQEVNKPPRGKRSRTGVVPPLSTRATLAAWPPEISNAQQRNGGSRSDMMPPPVVRDVRSSVAAVEQRTSSMPRVQTAHPVGTQADGIRMASGPGPEPEPEAEPERPVVSEQISVANVAIDDLEDIDMIDELESDTPFTYLASLSAKWTAMQHTISKVEGRIKCFLTGVKGFQFRQRTSYELRVYVDDGSLISEILIDHNVVEKCIGCSPVEACTALASSDPKIVDDMKNILKQFQMLLADFEGTMLVQMTEASPVPVAIDMNQGCDSSDALLLLDRFKSSYTGRLRSQQHPAGLNAINLSP